MINKFDLFKSNNLKVNWTTIIIGWRGFGKFPRQLSAKDVIDYAVSLVSDDESQPAEVWELASLSVSDTEKIYEILSRFPMNNWEQEQRKWRAILVKQLLVDIPTDYIQGLITLTDFWDKFGFPDDSPHILQGINNEISPTDYYTQENYTKILEAHRKWIESEIVNLV